MPRDSLIKFINNVSFAQVFRIAAIIIIGFIVARFVSDLVSKVLIRLGKAKYHQLVRKITFYSVLTLFVCSALIEMGFNLHVLLGAAGIFTVAFGLASQISFSNFISGLFLMGEGAIRVGDTIKIDGTTGDVVSLDLLSIKLRTAENVYVRIPNEVLIKTQISNLSRFPIRRLDLSLSVAYKENIETVRQVLSKIVDENSLCLKEPMPQVVVTAFSDSAISLRFSIWVNKDNYKALKNTIYEEIKIAFDNAAIEIPYPHRVILSG